jgi:hypothetical protein
MRIRASAGFVHVFLPFDETLFSDHSIIESAAGKLKGVIRAQVPEPGSSSDSFTGPGLGELRAEHPDRKTEGESHQGLSPMRQAAKNRKWVNLENPGMQTEYGAYGSFLDIAQEALPHEHRRK